MKKKCTKKKLTAEQKAAQLKKRKVLAFRKKIRSSFTDAGFTYFSTLDKHFPIGTRTVELDYLFLYENIIVICEDNTKQKKDIDHIRNKNESFAEIRNNKTAFLNWLSNTFPEKATMVKQYRPERYFLYYIYISQTELEITEDEKNRYSNLLFWDPETLSYFNRMAQCIQHSARYEIFRYLGLKNDEIGFSGSEGGKTTIKAPIIYPQEATGLHNGVRVVSFIYEKSAYEIGALGFSVQCMSRSNVVKNVSFDVHYGEILGIYGMVGAGRTELARLIFGVDQRDSGRVFLHGKDVTPSSPKHAIKAGIAFLTEACCSLIVLR